MTETLQYALLWSQSQCALHIESVQEMLNTGRRACTDDRRMDYVPIFLGSDEQCHTVASRIRTTMHERAQRRTQTQGS